MPQHRENKRVWLPTIVLCLGGQDFRRWGLGLGVWVVPALKVVALLACRCGPHGTPEAIIVNHRQLAFLIINSLIGNKLQGVETGPLEHGNFECFG